MGKEKDFSELFKIKKIFTEIANEMAEEVLWQIENTYESVIDEFYNHYNPLYYNRTFSTYLASSGYKDLYSSQNFSPINDGYEVGINVDSGNIPNNPYRADTDWVFNRTFVKGIHGISTRRGWGKTKEKKYQRIKGNKTFEVIYRQGATITKQKKYYEGNIEIQQRIMSNMVPAPRTLMNKWWRQFTTKHNLDQLYYSILESKLG